MSLDNAMALDTSRSVIVDACAGSGKTWLLSSRIARALVEGTPPRSILALTFTNKAAAEMRHRVVEHLREMANCSADRLREKLQEWGLAGNALEQAMHHAPCTLTRLLTDPQPPTISTFHSWYTRLVAMAPLSTAGWATMTLSTQSWELMRKSWQLFYSDHADDSPYAALVQIMGASAIRDAMEEWVFSRVEWQAFAQHLPLSQSSSDAANEALKEALKNNQAAISRFYQDQAARAARLADAYQGEEKQRADFYRALCNWAPDQIDQLQKALLTPKDLESRLSGPSASRFQLKWGEGRFIRQADRTRWGNRSAALEDDILMLAEDFMQLLDHNTVRLTQARNQALWACGSRLGRCMEAVMAQSHETDFAGLELAAWELLAGRFSQQFHARLGAQIRHVLVDEFQDTNPVQWAMLKAWFSEYLQADASFYESKPSVFLVGDPKQSIYRFRRADPQVFQAASDWLRTHYDAVQLTTNTTRRCSASVVSLLNAAMPGLAGGRFQRHDTHSSFGGMVARLPVADVTATASKWRAEGDQIAMALHQLRAITPDWSWSNVRLLSRTRTHMVDYEQALQAAGIPFVSDRSGGLIHEPEIRDVIALLRFLAYPWSDADLAHALKSPIFGITDAQLIRIVGHWPSIVTSKATGRATTAVQTQDHPSLFQRLEDLVHAPDATPELRAAADRLRNWLGLAEQLPVHDLLDRVLHEQNVFDRIAQRFAQTRGLQSLANLEAFLELALELDTGRLPSLQRFLQEMERWSHAPAKEAPGPGPMPVTDAVQLSSLHSAKGLEADVVVLAGMLDTEGKDKGLRWLMHWNVGRDQLLGVAAWKSDEPIDASIGAALHDEQRQARHEDFNLLYVGITRSKKVLLLSAAQGNKDRWYDQLEHACPLWDPRQTIGEFQSQAFSDVLGQELSAKEKDAHAKRQHPLPLGHWRGIRLGTPHGERRIADPTSDRLVIRQGKALHRLLEFGPALRADMARQLLAEFALPRAARDEVMQAVLKIGQHSVSQAVFHPECLAFAEAEWPDIDQNAGRVLRPDRVVRISESPETWWVIDFKWRVLPSELSDYANQLRNYQQLFQSIRPNAVVEAKILTADAQCWALRGERLIHSG